MYKQYSFLNEAFVLGNAINAAKNGKNPANIARHIQKHGSMENAKKAMGTLTKRANANAKTFNDKKIFDYGTKVLAKDHPLGELGGYSQARKIAADGVQKSAADINREVAKQARQTKGARAFLKSKK